MIEIKHKETGEVIYTFSGKSLIKAYLGGANLWEANLREADLWGADLWGANLSGANLRGANLREADLTGATLCNATIDGAILYENDIGGPGHILCALTDEEWEMIEAGRLSR